METTEDLVKTARRRLKESLMQEVDQASVILSGKGLHGGQASRLRFNLPSQLDPSGLVRQEPHFSAPNLSQRMSIEDISRLPRTAERSTILGNDPNTIRTTEHLWAALLFFRDLPLEMNCDVSELPCLDGSALPFREALSHLSPTHAVKPRWHEYACDLQWDYAWGYGHLHVCPAPFFRVRYILDRGPVFQSFTLEGPEDAWHEILPARSFVFHREWEAGKAKGLMLGADLDSGLLLAESEAEYNRLLLSHSLWCSGPFPLLNQPKWRMQNELVKHKILDLLGDLALAGLALPKLDIEIRNGGHSVNHLLLEKLSLS